MFLYDLTHNPFSLSGLLLGGTCTILLFFLFLYGKNRLHFVWTMFNISVAIWGYSAYFIGKSTNSNFSLFLWKVSFFGVLFIPVFFYHFCCLFCQIKRKNIVLCAYFQAFFFLILNWFTQVYITNTDYLWGSIYYLKSSGLYFPLSFFLWVFFVVLGHIEVISSFKKFDPSKRIQALYFFIGFFIGFLGGTTNFFPMFGLDLYPYGNFTVSLYCVLVSYAILKHRLLDVSIAVTRTGILVIVYSLVLGIPFALAFLGKNYLQTLLGENWWTVPLLTSTVLATAGPYIYSFFQQKTEDKLLQEQRRYQSTLRQASLGMGRIKDLKRLLQLIVHIVTRAVRIEHCEIFLFHEESNQFVLKASKSRTRVPDANSIYNSDSELVAALRKIKEPLVYEEIKQMAQDSRDQDLILLEKIMSELDAALIVPSFIEDRLIAFIVLGRKLSKKLYSQDDLVVFAILANQSALAIENAQFYDDMKKTHEQLFKAEKMATLGTMADGLSHQINNRLHAMGFVAGDALDTLKMRADKKLNSTDAQVIDEMQKALERIQENVKRGGEIVGGLLKYSRKGEEGFESVSLDALINAALEMAQFKIKVHELKVVRNYAKETVPQIYGNFTQLQEVFFNMIDNAYDAMMQRKEELKEEGYQPTIKFSASKKGKNIEILIEDNGIGVKEEDKRKLFTPFFTTKLSSRKGTGLGLYVIRQLIEENHKGKVQYSSEYMQGTITQILLPVARK